MFLAGMRVARIATLVPAPATFGSPAHRSLRARQQLGWQMPTPRVPSQLPQQPLTVQSEFDLRAIGSWISALRLTGASRWLIGDWSWERNDCCREFS
jgi:hypothetical protein